MKQFFVACGVALLLAVGIAVAQQQSLGPATAAYIGGLTYDSTAGSTAGTGISIGGTFPKQSIAVAASGVSAGSYACANVTVDATGRVSSAANGNCSGGSTNLPGGSSGQIQYNVGGTSFGGFTASGDCTVNTGTGLVTCTKTSGVAFGTFATANAATPPAIGGTTPAAGNFTTLGATGNLTTNVTGSTQCLHANSSGIVSGAGADCSTPVVSGVLPMGRLTLTSGTPVMTADATAQGTIYYDTYISNTVPIWGGSALSLLTIGSNEISLVLDSTNDLSGKLYDVFAFNNSGTLTLCSGAAWSSSTARSVAIALKGGVWTNGAALTHCYNNSIDYGSISTNLATYLGTFYATANGQTGMQFNPAGAAGGSNNILGLWNAYNRVPLTSTSTDSNASWTNTSNTWVKLDSGASGGGANNRISWVDGLAQSSVTARVAGATAQSSSSHMQFGVNFNSTTAAPTQIVGDSTATTVQSVVGIQATAPILGFNYAQGMESNVGNTGTATQFANWFVALDVSM